MAIKDHHLASHGDASSLPLIKSPRSGETGGGDRTSAIQTLGNIIVSIVGTGVLGLPYAFRIAGWFAGSLGVVIVGFATYYCMLLLIQCRDKLEAEEGQEESKTYGDLGFKCMGTKGRYLTEFLIFTAQCGGSVAYLVFIGRNMSSIFASYGLSMVSFILILVPIEVALSWITSLSALSPFSIFADICNIIAMCFVVKENVEMVIGGDFSFGDRTAVSSSIGGLPFAGGVAVFCFEGFAMTLALENSMKDREAFPKLLAKVLAGITFVYVLFGFCGYMAYGDETKDIITLNLPKNWSAIAVQIGLCVGLTFTFPIMVHPLNEIIEQKLKRIDWLQKHHHHEYSNETGSVSKYVIFTTRTLLVVGLAAIASLVPGFGTFASLVGSTLCALISFVLPASYHLTLLGPSLSLWNKSVDVFIVICGLLFAVYGTYNTIVGV
ncbi:Amino acid transporter ANT1 [Raphanus sativus]|uniref:Amino acid transporter ANT1-like n=1 Tax=Raphanus sativus TaxID=3726 RepID=A0A9W3CSL1_RAPSA|nr:amino acid transporter ANT1-like [Raphanus sativus]KAJ4869860.1 Amino acid transporter ANT1 [Raphanus sativus]